LTIKSLERRLDGLVEPDGHSGPAYVVEFQAQSADQSLYNLAAKMGLYGEEHTDEEIWAMLNLVTPLEETKAYQSIFAKGEAKGKAGTLCRLLTRRFDTLPTWAEQRIAAASETQLDTWLDGIFDAASVEDLLGAEE
jgi:predicted transposase YdaD